jgi:hypothetical protein
VILFIENQALSSVTMVFFITLPRVSNKNIGANKNKIFTIKIIPSIIVTRRYF